MNIVKLGFESMTIAIKAKKLLKKSGVYSVISKLDTMHEGGCQYVLEISEKDYFLSVSILIRANINYRVNY